MVDSPGPEIHTDRFVLRPLRPEDATPRYLRWLHSRLARRYIQGATARPTLVELRAYIAARHARSDVLFLGIFLRSTGEHIGNIKYEPIDSVRRTAEMGILVGERTWRGRSVAAEVIRASAEWLHSYRDVRKILLGVDLANKGALAAYRKVGFRPYRQIAPPKPPKGVLRMVLKND